MRICPASVCPWAITGVLAEHDSAVPVRLVTCLHSRGVSTCTLGVLFPTGVLDEHDSAVPVRLVKVANPYQHYFGRVCAPHLLAVGTGILSGRTPRKKANRI